MTTIDCPFCGTNLMYDENDLMCPCPCCEATDGCWGNGEIWELLVKTKKKLDIAITVLKRVNGVCNDNKCTDHLYAGLDVLDTTNLANDVKQALVQLGEQQ